MIKVALVDDHAILRKSLAILINMFDEFEVVMEAGNGQEFIDKLSQNNQPDVALLDITMPVMDGVETAKWIKRNHPRIKVIALSMLKNDLVIIRMLKNGAKGYVLKDCEPAELRDAILSVHGKGYYYNEVVTPRMFTKEKQVLDTSDKVMMNEGEINFLRLICTDKTYKEIADIMGLSTRTIDGYRDSLCAKLKVNSRVGLALYAIKHEIVVL